MYDQKVGSESRGDLCPAIQADNLGGSNTREEIPKLGMSRQTGPQRASQSSLAPEVENGPMVQKWRMVPCNPRSACWMSIMCPRGA